MKKILSVFVSNRTTIVLLAIFAFAQARGTFIENDYGTPAAQAYIYDSWWFELVMALLAVNFIANIKRFGLLRKERRSLLMFHFGFIVILIGAFVTRYTGFEGMLDVREGQSKDYILSEDNFIHVQVGEDYVVKKINPTAKTMPHFNISVGSGNQTASIKALDFIDGAKEKIVEGTDHILHVVIAEDNHRQNYYIKEGTTAKTSMGDIAFASGEDADVTISKRNDELFITSKTPLEFMEMAAQVEGEFPADTATPLKFAALYRTAALRFVVKSSHPNAKLIYQTVEDKKRRKSLPGKLVLEVASAGEKKEAVMDYYRGSSTMKIVEVAGNTVEIIIGPKRIPLGFAIYLKDFELIRYPGSTSPSSFSSYVEVVDGESSFPYHIYMNNVLDYNGFRFFQSSYDQDELGTVLSVNHDWWGTWITYLGYLLMGMGMVWSVFAKGSRFTRLNQSLKKVKSQKAALTVALLFMGAMGFAQEPEPKTDIPVERVAAIYPTEVMDNFGALLIQDMDGRIKPVNSLASELTRKLTGKTKFNLDYNSEKVTLNANQLFFAIHANPQFWLLAPVIKIDPEKGALILERLGKEKGTEHIAVRDFFGDQGNYLMEDMVDEAFQTKPAERNKHMEEVIKVDERFNILYQALTDSYIKIFPKPGDQNHKWYSDKSTLLGFDHQDSLFVKSIFPLLYMSADSAFETGNWSQPNALIGYMSTFQQEFAKEVIPSENRVKAELLYNKLKLFLHLFYSYWILGIGLLVLAILRLFYDHKLIHTLQKTFFGITFLLFLLHTFNIILRWYAGNYPPWSNGYEMIVLVSWATMLFGLLFSRRTDFILPLASLFTGTLLFVAFLDWLNPEITNLVPVLKSYWLKIHVAIIVGSYAPLALSALLGFTAMWMMIGNRKGNKRVLLSLKEITLLNEISMTIGIYMLAIGTFLGGVWANESWGRYWGWDPKETWALISVIVYAIVLHFRLIPAIKNQQYWFNAMAVVAFFSIIMTSFGVNYYLSGLHSYATGDPVPIPTWVHYVVALVMLTVVLGYFNKKAKPPIKE